MNYKDIYIGQSLSVERVFQNEEVALFSKMSGDLNPIHTNVEYSLKTKFKQCIVQGPFVNSLLGGILGSYLPGEGTIYLKQTTSFLKPVFIGERVVANVMVIAKRSDKPVVTLRTWVEKGNAEIVIEGEAIVLFLGSLLN